MIDFSIILPTRNNITGLIKLLDSFVNKAYDKECFEFLIAPDIDDPELYRIKEEVKGYPVRVYETHRTDNFNRDYFNWLAHKAKGKSIWVMNDDVEILTQDWDRIINEKIGEKEFYFIDVYDTTYNQGDQTFPRFPLIAKKCVDTIGFVFYPQLRTYPADKVIYELYKMVDLIVPCHEVELLHKWIPQDDISKEKIFSIFIEDVENGVLPVNVYIQRYLLTKALKKDWHGEKYQLK